MVGPIPFTSAACGVAPGGCHVTGRQAARGTLLLVLLTWASSMAIAGPITETIDAVQPKMVKIYGAGGLQGMEAYQSGMLVSPEGHVLTAFSHVLDTDDLVVALGDGRRLQAKLLGADPRLEVAVLKVEGKDLPHFDLAKAAPAERGTRVLALSNMFGVAAGEEPVTVQHGSVAAITRLEARQGVFETPYDGPVYVLDVVTNNPGAAGGALVNRRGELLGMLGKELRNARNNTYLNYALPIRELRESVDLIRQGKFVARKPDTGKKKPERALSPAVLGLALVPDVVERTPPYVDRVLRGSAAAKAGLRPDDLIVLVNDRLVQSCRNVVEELSYVDQEEQVRLSVIRGREMIEVVIDKGYGTP
jgi:S1-C subfamily serine protease